MQRELAGSVVVVTGATSGLGRATAHALARYDARLVLVARDGAGLAQVVRDCEDAGAATIAVTADVGELHDLRRILADAVARFGRVDSWVNAAAVLVAGDVTDTPADELAGLVTTNVLGTLLASRIALEQFDEQGHGVLVNVSSVLGVVPNPMVPAYTMSKFAVRGLSLSLRLMPRPRAIRVCTVLPGPLDTPMFERAANHTGRRLRAIPPPVAPERGAAAIVRCLRRPRRQVVVGWAGVGVLLSHRVAPRITEAAVGRIAARLLLRPEPAPDSAGAVFGWDGPAKMSGDWRHWSWRRRAGSSVGKVAAR